MSFDSQEDHYDHLAMLAVLEWDSQENHKARRDSLVPLQVIVAKALRQAVNAKLEEAVAAVDQEWAGKESDDGPSPYILAEAIRKLKV